MNAVCLGMGLNNLFPLASPENRARFAEFVQLSYERFRAFEQAGAWGEVETRCRFQRGVGLVVVDAGERCYKAPKTASS